MKFGTLPALIFPPSNVSSSNFSYSIDTTTGKFDPAPKLLKVYFIPQLGVSLLAPDRSKKMAESLGFPQGPIALAATEYQFSDTDQGKLTINLPTGNFSFQRSATSSAALKSASPSAQLNLMADQPTLINEFKDYLFAKSLLPDELKSGRSRVEYDGPSQAQSNTAIISLWPTDIDAISIVAPSINTGLVRGVRIKTDDDNSKFSSVDYTFWPIDKSTFSTYPLKTVDQAFSELQSGKGYIGLEPTSAKVSITSEKLAYYEAKDYSPYLQPVFVFEGPHFAAYIPAIATNP